MSTSMYTELATLLVEGARGGEKDTRSLGVELVAERSARAFVEAHDRVSHLEATFAHVDPGFAAALLALDGEYQRGRDELRARTGRAPPVRTLTGDVPEPDAARALDHLRRELARHKGSRWAQRRLEGALGALPDIVERAIARAADTEDLDAARSMRARVFGAARERFELDLAARDRLGPALRAAPDGVAWTQAVVMLWNEDIAEKGSGVFLRPNLIVTAAHVISSGNTVDPARVRAQRGAGGEEITAIAIPYLGDPRDDDLALVQVPYDGGAALAVKLDFDPPPGFEISRYGYPTGAGPRGSKGHISRWGEIFYTSDVRVPAGASGGAVAALFHDGVRLVGITTSDEPGADEEWAMGIPLPADLGARAG